MTVGIHVIDSAPRPWRGSTSAAAIALFPVAAAMIGVFGLRLDHYIFPWELSENINKQLGFNSNQGKWFLPILRAHKKGNITMRVGIQ